jgi:hypothetical protein
MTIFVDVPYTNVAGNCVTYVRTEMTEEQYAEYIARQTGAVIVETEVSELAPELELIEDSVDTSEPELPLNTKVSKKK